jgi:capsid protein
MAKPRAKAPAASAAAPAPRQSPAQVIKVGGGKASTRTRRTYGDLLLKELRKVAEARRSSYRAALNPRSRVQTALGGSGDSHADQLTRRLLRELARDLDRNASAFTTLHSKFAQFLTGRGVPWIPRTGNAAWDKAAQDYLAARMQSQAVDVRGLRTGYDLQGLYARGYAVDGDALSILLEGGRIQLIEGEQLDGDLNTKDLLSSTGISTNDDGAATVFNIRPYGPGEWLGQSEAFTPDQVTYTANSHRPSQTRGTPLLHACLDDFERADSYVESEVIAAEVSSQIWVTLNYREGKTPQLPYGQPDDAAQNDSAVRGGLKSNGEVDWQPSVAGSALVAPDGMTANPWNPQRPNVNAEPFLIWLLRSWCGSIGVAYELIFNDLRSLSWAVAKSYVDLTNATIADIQTKKLDAPFRRWYLHLIANAINAGHLPANAQWFVGDLDWPRLTEPDDEKRFKANQAGYQSGQTSRRRQLGNDWQHIISELGEEYRTACKTCRAINQEFPEFPVRPEYFLGGQPAGTVPTTPAETAPGTPPVSRESGDEPAPGVGSAP